MKILYSTHSETRVRAHTVDTGAFHNITDADDFYDPLIEYPINYVVKVQIRLLHVFWVTVWSATVELSDEAIEAVNKRARDLADTLSCTGL